MKEKEGFRKWRKPCSQLSGRCKVDWGQPTRRAFASRHGSEPVQGKEGLAEGANPLKVCPAGVE